MFKKSRIIFFTVYILCTLTLYACSSENPDITTVNSTPDTTFSSVQTTLPEIDISVSENETTAMTASPSVIQDLIDEAELPQIVITENSAPEEILQAGKTAATFYGKLVDKYFEYGVNYNWKMASGDEDGDIYTDENSNSYYKCYGLYTDRANGIYVPMTFNEVKNFLMSYMSISENGFDDLCRNSPSKYISVDDVCFLMSGDGGQAGWDYSYIKDYEISNDSNSITYNCERFGDKENWGYNENLTEPFTFSIIKDNGIWKLDSCSNCEAFCNGFIGLESDIENYDNSSTNTEDTTDNNPTPVKSISEQTNADIVSEIKQTLTEFADFSYNYLQCKAYMFGENLDTTDTLKVDNMVYYRAISGDYTRYSDLMAAIDRYCSEDVINECNLKKFSYYEGDNDGLYISEEANGNGGVMGSDVAYITSIEILDDNSVKVNMVAWGDKEEWGYTDGDSVIPFEITMTSENNLWKIDKCGLMEMDYITWLFEADY